MRLKRLFGPAVVSLAAVVSPLALGNCPQFDGSLQQGGFIWGQVAPGSVVTLDGEQLDVLADGTTFAGFGRDVRYGHQHFRSRFGFWD